MAKITITIRPGDTLEKIGFALGDLQGFVYDGEQVDLVFEGKDNAINSQAADRYYEELGSSLARPIKPTTDLQYRRLYVDLLEQAQEHGIVTEWCSLLDNIGNKQDNNQGNDDDYWWSSLSSPWSLYPYHDDSWWRVRVKGAELPNKKNKFALDCCERLLAAAKSQGALIVRYNEKTGHWMPSSASYFAHPYLYRIVGKV